MNQYPYSHKPYESDLISPTHTIQHIPNINHNKQQSLTTQPTEWTWSPLIKTLRSKTEWQTPKTKFKTRPLAEGLCTTWKVETLFSNTCANQGKKETSHHSALFSTTDAACPLTVKQLTVQCTIISSPFSFQLRHAYFVPLNAHLLNKKFNLAKNQ